jgi:ferredoxin
VEQTKIAKVWIEDGCISCSLCQDYCPEVFYVEDGEICLIKDDAMAHFEEKEEDIRLAEEDCPVEVIKVEG